MYATDHLYGPNADPILFETDANIPRTETLQELFSPQRFRENTEIVVSKLEQYLADQSVRGLALTDPERLLQTARGLMAGKNGAARDSTKARLEKIVDLYIETGIQVHSTGYMGRQFSGVFPLAGSVDLIGSVMNQPSSFYEAGQLPNVAERIMADELSRYIGWKTGQYAMVTTSGGSLANLTALLAARNDKYPEFWNDGAAAPNGAMRPAIAASEDMHYSISRAAGILGIGERQIVRLPINRKRQIRTDRVRPALAEAAARGLKVFCMVASAGTTSVGAFDRLDTLAGIAEEHGIWLHVDGAHGASLLLSDKLRHKLKGIELVDSFAWDAHKMLFVPPACTLLFYKNPQKSRGAFRQDASYVFEKQPDAYTEFDSAEKNFECTKRPLIMNLWVLWALYGSKPFSDKIEYLCRLTESAHRILATEADFETLHRPEANILCFRYRPANLTENARSGFQTAIRNRIRERGKFFISKVDIDGADALRVVFMNHRITAGHFQMLLDEVRKIGQELLTTPNQEAITVC